MRILNVSNQEIRRLIIHPWFEVIDHHTLFWFKNNSLDTFSLWSTIYFWFLTPLRIYIRIPVL